MKKAIIIAVLLFSVGITQAACAGVVDEAKGQIAKEKHETLVFKAKQLIQREEEIRKELSAIQLKLEVLERGEDVDISKIGSGVRLSDGTTIWMK